MRPTLHLAARVVVGAGAIALFVVTANAQISDKVRGKASEANHFIETPNGWTPKRTPWGDPDLEGTWPIPGGINLERSCPRAGGPGRGGPGAPPAAAVPAPAAPACDPNSPPAFLTEEQFKARL